MITLYQTITEKIIKQGFKMTKNEIKFIKGLSKKVERYSSGFFVVEGEKMIKELLESGLEIETIYSCDPKILLPSVLISVSDMERISNLKTPTSALAVLKIPKYGSQYKGGIALVLDTVQDPGNLGTIIRLAAWYGVNQIFCSLDSVDCFSPKAVQATMGAIASVELVYCDLETLFKQNQGVSVYGTFLENSTSINEIDFSKDSFIVMGNEGQGISFQVEEYVSKRIFLPPYGDHKNVESLNVAIATAITLSEIRRPRF